MALLSLITEQSTVPCVPTIYLFLGDHFGVDKKKSGDHFGIGIISGSIWGSFQGWGSFRGRDHFGGCTVVPLKVLHNFRTEFPENYLTI